MRFTQGRTSEWKHMIGISSLSRIMGFLLVCIGVQFAINGVRDLVLDVSFWNQ